MNINVSIPLFSALFYLVLIVFVLNSTLNKVKRVFIWYLTTQMLWSLSSFIAHGNYFPESTLVIHEFLIAAGFVVPIAYYHFVATFTNRMAPLLFILSFVVLGAIIILDFGGFIVLSSVVVDYMLIYKTSFLYYISFLVTFIFLGFSVYYLIQRYRSIADPLERNRVAYLLSGLGVNLAFLTTLFFDATAKYPIDHVGNMAHVAIISYAIMKYQMLNIKFVARRSLASALLIIPMAGIYATLIIVGQQIFPTLPTYSVVLLAAGLAIALVLIFRTLWRSVQELIDRFFYKDTYKHRQTLLNLGNKLGGVINLNQLADEILPALCKALRVTRAQLLLRDANSGNFSTHFVYPVSENSDGELSLNVDNPIITWLEKKNRPLELRQTGNIPEFKGLWQTEKEQVTASNLGLLSPIKNQGALIGVFALGKKQQDGLYSQEDIEMMMTVASQAGTIIENAQHYSQALVKASTDGLTQLYNHRHFHERLEQEIARSSRFGTAFSVIMLDIDLFKVYNDNYGHLAGDEVLRRIGEHIKSCLRSIDIAARYGGEEFAVILPETRLVDAYVVAERIRKTIEIKTRSLAMPVTVSVGVASWPVDGVMKEELIARADKALYQAKESGRNRTCLSTEVAEPEPKVTEKEMEINPKALNIIYALAATVDAKDHYTYGHSRKVSEYASAIAEAIKLPREKISLVHAAGLLHDIGKIGIPDSVLNKKETLSSEEWEPIKAHPHLGIAIIRNIIDLTNCLPAILHHHEHFDGTGYPAGLKGKNIPIEARILAIADAYEAMTSPRAYRKQLTTQGAIEELKQHAGTQFDPELVEVFCKILDVTPSWRQ